MEELSWRDRGRLWLRLGIRFILGAVALLLFVLAGPPLLSLLAPFVLALLMAWLLNPAVRFFQKKIGGSRRLWSLTLLLGLLLLLCASLVILVYNIFTETRSLVDNWQAIWDSVQAAVDQISGLVDDLFPYLPAEVVLWFDALVTRALTWFQTAIPDLLSALAAGAGSTAMKVPSFAVATIVFIMGSYFITADYPHIRYLVVSRMSSNSVGLLRFIKYTASAAFGGYVRAQFILSLAVFFILLAGFMLTGQSYALILALLFAIMDFIPIIGAGTAMIPWAILSLFFGDLRSAVELLVIWGIIALFRRIAEPKVVGNQTGLSPILSLISIYVGMKLAGIPGMILGPVVFLVAINVCKAGVFDNVLADLHLAAKDIQALLRVQR